MREHDPALAALMTGAYSTSTWNGRLRVSRELQAIGGSFEAAAATFLRRRVKQGLKSATVARDIGHIKWLAKLLNVESAALTLRLSTLQRGLRHREAAVEVTTKALPMTRSVLARLLANRQLSRPTKLALLLAFRTGSRVADVFALQPRRAFLPHRRGAMLVCWGMTKAHMTVEARPDHQQILEKPGALSMLLSRPRLLEHASKKEVAKALASVRPSPTYIERWQRLNPTVNIRQRFTLHSLKRGRAAELWNQGRMSTDEVMFELKHQDIKSALAHAPSPAATAEALKREKALRRQQSSSPKRKPSSRS